MKIKSCIVLAIVFLTFSSCSNRNMLKHFTIEQNSQILDSTSFFSDGIVIPNYGRLFIDINRSYLSSIKISSDLFKLLRSRGYNPLARFINGYSGQFLKPDSICLILPPQSDSLIVATPPFRFENKDTVPDAVLAFTRFLYNQPANTTLLTVPPKFDLKILKNFFKSQYALLTLFMGIDSKPISKETKLVWKAASLIITSGCLAITPYTLSTLHLTVALVDFNTGDFLIWYQKGVGKEIELYPLLDKSLDDLQSEFPCKNKDCPSNSIFYNPFKR